MDPYARSRRHGRSTDNEVRWIQTYVLDEGDGTRRIIWIYEAPSLEAIREHASRANLLADKIIPIAETVSSGPTRTERIATDF